MERFAIRIWLPDRPGALEAMAQRIAATGGNVVGFEVLERDGGVAVDELLVELPEAGMSVAMCASLAEIEGAGIEEARPVAADVGERGLQVIDAAGSILAAATASAALSALVDLTGRLFELDWTALVDLGAGSVTRANGPVPPLSWLRTVGPGAGGDGANGTTGTDAACGADAPDTAGTGVLAEQLMERRLVFFVGRRVPFRRRERRELAMLVKVADRMCKPLHGDRIPAQWGAQTRFV